MAVNPEVIACPANTWVKVAAGVLVGTIYRASNVPPKYIQTIRVEDDAAPTDNTDAAALFQNSPESVISSDTKIDVYVKAVRAAGSVRVDL